MPEHRRPGVDDHNATAWRRAAQPAVTAMPTSQQGGGRKPITPEQRARIIELCGQDAPRNEIARDVGLSGSVVSKIAAEIGHEFAARTQTRNALAARKVDLAARRTVLLVGLYDEAEARLQQRTKMPWRTILKGSFGVESIDEIGFIPSRDYRDEQAAQTHLFSSINKLEAADAGGAVEQERSLLAALGEALGVTGPDA